MLLNDIGLKPTAKFRKINRYLEENHGFKISSNLDENELSNATRQINEEINQLKLKGDTSLRSAEISRCLLVLEGLKALREFSVNFKGATSPAFRKILGHLIDYVVDAVEMECTGQEDYNACFEEAIRNAMKEYRSSRYRFDDTTIENALRNEAAQRLHSLLSDDESSLHENITEDKWIETDPKKAGMFKGKTKADLESQKETLKKKNAKHKGDVPESDKEKMAQLNFAIRAKSKSGL